MNKFTLVAIAMALGASTTLANAVSNESTTAPTQPQFEAFDLDNNGAISTHEAIKDPLLQSIFKKIDANNDEKLSKDEYLGYKEMQVKKSG